MSIHFVFLTFPRIDDNCVLLFIFFLSFTVVILPKAPVSEIIISTKCGSSSVFSFITRDAVLEKVPCYTSSSKREKIKTSIPHLGMVKLFPSETLYIYGQSLKIDSGPAITLVITSKRCKFLEKQNFIQVES